MSEFEKFLFEVAATPQIKAERKWLEGFVKAGIFDPGYLKKLDDLHFRMLGDNSLYLKDVKNLQKNLGRNSNDVYVVRPHYSGKNGRAGGGYNIVFTRSSLRHDFLEIEEEYGYLCNVLKVQEIQIPFNVLLASYYFLGDKKYKGGRELEEERNMVWAHGALVEEGIKALRERWVAIFKLAKPKTSFKLPKLPEQP